MIGPVVGDTVDRYVIVNQTVMVVKEPHPGQRSVTWPSVVKSFFLSIKPYFFRG